MTPFLAIRFNYSALGGRVEWNGMGLAGWLPRTEPHKHLIKATRLRDHRSCPATLLCTLIYVPTRSAFLRDQGAFRGA